MIIFDKESDFRAVLGKERKLLFISKNQNRLFADIQGGIVLEGSSDMVTAVKNSLEKEGWSAFGCNIVAI